MVLIPVQLKVTEFMIPLVAFSTTVFFGKYLGSDDLMVFLFHPLKQGKEVAVG